MGLERIRLLTPVDLVPSRGEPLQWSVENSPPSSVTRQLIGDGKNLHLPINHIIMMNTGLERSLILSQTSEYALRAMLHLAEVEGDKPTRVGDIAEALSVPRNYLSKILHTLARSGLLISFRGPGGGFALAPDSKSTRLVSIVELFDRSEPEGRCFLGRPQCLDEDPCPAHAQWGDIKNRILFFLNETTIESLAHEGLPPTSSE